MKPVDQTTFFPNGNCYQAAVASILDLSLDEVPDLYFDTAIKQMDVLNKWLNTKGQKLCWDKDEPIEKEFYLVSDKSSRGCMHCVVFSKGKMVHDPHPSRSGLLETEERYFEWFENNER